MDLPDSKTLLICTVGGTPQPVVKAIEKIRPERVIFVCSKDTAPDLSGPKPRFSNPPRDARLISNPPCDSPPVQPQWLEADVNSAATEKVPVRDAQRVDLIIESIHKKLDDAVRKWFDRGAGHNVVVDITGGTKAMSAALALCARQWDCQFYYTGGTQREKANVGVVKDGSEQAFETANPWGALGYQAMDEFRLFFNKGNFAAAQMLADAEKKRTKDGSLTKKFQALGTLAKAYVQWESFKHNDALNILKEVRGRYANDMAACGEAFWNDTIQSQLERNIQQLQHLVDAGKAASAALVRELLANAERRGAEGRLDDAVARLYRCTEAIAQAQLLSERRLDSAAVPLEKLPDSLREKWSSRAEDGLLKLALQDDYALLAELRDGLGIAFRNQRMDGEKSPLSARNGSILAHGFQPISKAVYDELLKCVKELAGILAGGADSDIEFPQLG